MLKNFINGSLAAAIALSGLALAVPAQAREGGTSIGHGIKCYYYLGIRYCYKGA